MRLLNTVTLRLESYPTAEEAPPYAILSHTWGEQEILHSDLVGKPHDKEFLDLQARFDDLASRFETLESRLSGETPSISHEESATQRYRNDSSIALENTLLARAKQKKGWILHADIQAINRLELIECWHVPCYAFVTSKVEGCCKEAARFGLGYVWIDTCCIYKEDSSELSEAINSMFAWYTKAQICFEYLSDASNIDDAFGSPNAPISDRIMSRWFRRGWTLQELIAPKALVFINKTGSRLVNGLYGEHASNLSMATKISWSVGRNTARPEDGIYSLMGLFSVTMPIIYGEGKQSAFFRLQSEIFRASGDHSIFAWTSWPRSILIHSSLPSQILGSIPSKELITLYPKMFTSIKESNTISDDMPSFDIEPSPYDPNILEAEKSFRIQRDLKYSAITHGIRVQLLIEETGQFTKHGRQIFLAHLACKIKHSTDIVGIYLILQQPGQYLRVKSGLLVSIGLKYHSKCRLSLEDVYITSPKSKTTAQLDLHLSYLLKYGPLTQHVELIDSDLQKLGFMAKEWSECTEYISDTGKRQLLFDSELTKKRRDLKTHVILFKNLSTPDSGVIAVTWKVDEYLRVCNQVQFRSETTVARIQELSKTLSFTLYSPAWTGEFNDGLNWFETHWAQLSENGAGISIAIRHLAGKLMMKIIII